MSFARIIVTVSSFYKILSFQLMPFDALCDDSGSSRPSYHYFPPLESFFDLENNVRINTSPISKYVLNWIYSYKFSEHV